jgi:hypothetical protein
MISSQQFQWKERNKFQIFKIRGKNEKNSNVELHGKNLVKKNFFSKTQTPTSPIHTTSFSTIPRFVFEKIRIENSKNTPDSSE